MTGIMCALLGMGKTFDGTYNGVAGSGSGYVGFSTTSPAIGTITPSWFLPDPSSTFRLLAQFSGDTLRLQVNGSPPNSGWSTMTINATAFNRADATYFTAGANTHWTWTPASQPFTDGAPFTVTFA